MSLGEQSVVHLMSGHSDGDLNGLATHPTLQMFASGSDDKSIKIWDLGGFGVLPAPFAANGQSSDNIGPLCFSPDRVVLFCFTKLSAPPTNCPGGHPNGSR